MQPPARLALALALPHAQLLEARVRAPALDVGPRRRRHAGLRTAHQPAAQRELRLRRVVDRTFPPGDRWGVGGRGGRCGRCGRVGRGVGGGGIRRGDDGAAVGANRGEGLRASGGGGRVPSGPVSVPPSRRFAVVAREGPALIGHLVRGRHVEVRGEPAALVVANGVGRHRPHRSAVGVDHHEPEPGEGQHGAEGLEVDPLESLLEPADGRLRGPDPAAQVALAEVGQAAHADHEPPGQRVVGPVELLVLDVHGLTMAATADTRPPVGPSPVDRVGPGRYVTDPHPGSVTYRSSAGEGRRLRQ